MADEDVNDLLDAPTRNPNRTVRFAPKGAKFKPKPKIEQLQSPSTPDHVESLPVLKKEDLDVTKPEYANNAFDMDVDIKPCVQKQERDDLKEEERYLIETEEMEVELEDDVVIREIDVYFSPSIDPRTQMCLFQYPLRPQWRPYELDQRCKEVRVKPESKEVEIDLEIDEQSKNYDSDADPRVQMKKQILSTSWKPLQTRADTVGILTRNKLHLTPIHAVFQLRPSMHHLDSKEPKRKTGAHGNSEVAVKSEEDQEVKPSGISAKLRKISEQTKDREEVWDSLKYYGAESNMAAGYLRKLMEKEGSQSQILFSMRNDLKTSRPGTSIDSFSSKGPPRRLLNLPLEERLKTWLCEGTQVHRFDTLKYLAPDKSPEELFEVLHEHARLLQGLWVAKSSLVYATFKNKEDLTRARDHVLLLFSKSVTIKKSDIQLNKQMEYALSLLAIERPVMDDWKLKELPDLSFKKLYPSVVRKHEEEWERLEQEINGFIFGAKTGPGLKASSKTSTINNLKTSKGPNEIATGTPSGSTPRTGMPEEVREATTKALLKLLKSTKVCRFEQISQRLRAMADSEAVAAAESIDAFPDELEAIISQVAINIHGICVPISSPDNQFNDFRRVVIDLFIAGGPNAKVKKATMLEAGKQKLNRDVPVKESKKVLAELCESRGSAWVLKSSG